MSEAPPIIDPSEAPDPDAMFDRAVPGGKFIFSAEEEIPCVWGDGEEVAWIEGEPLYMCGPPGVGKTTVAQQLALARVGVTSDLLGMPVVADERKLLYVAADRHRQAQRSMRRMVCPEEHEAVLDERLTFWKGPLPFDLGTEPERLAKMADYYEAGTVILDSLKDVALDLTEDATGARVNHALQIAVSENVEVLVLHHQRKASAGNTRPNSLDDVYGSRWLTAGAGSVFMLWGAAGDPIVDLLHLKQPAAPVGPLKVLHDHSAGCSSVHNPKDLFEHLTKVKHGLTVREAAIFLTGNASPEDKDIERARRKLNGLVRRELAVHRAGNPGGAGGGGASRYFARSLLEEIPA